jgi:putative cardiolipin synthase
MGVVLDCPPLAARMAEVLDRDAELDAYHVRLDAGGDLEWVERTPEGERIHTSEPETGFWRRFGVGFLSWLPIEWML